MDDTQAALSDLCDALAHPDNVLNVATSHAYRSAIAALAASREKACEQAPVYIEGVNVERLQRACTQQGISIEGSREALIAPSAMADAINSLTQSVVSASNYVHHSRCPAPAGEPEDVLATYNRTDGRREWVNLGTWLRRGEEIVQRSIAVPATVGEPVAWMTRTDEGDPAMLFFDRAEAVQYCDDGEQPAPLYEAAAASTQSAEYDDGARPIWEQVAEIGASAPAEAWDAVTPSDADRLREAADAVMAHQWSNTGQAMHALQVLIDTAHAVADQQGTAVTGTPAVALPVEQVFMPSGWLVVREDGMDKFLTEFDTVADGFVHNGWGKSPLYDQAAVDAAVAAERSRLAHDVADLHMSQSLNNQSHPAAWHDGVDAALAAIRGA